MKKFFSLLLIIFLLLSFTTCESNKKETSSVDSTHSSGNVSVTEKIDGNSNDISISTQTTSETSSDTKKSNSNSYDNIKEKIISETVISKSTDKDCQHEFAILDSDKKSPTCTEKGLYIKKCSKCQLEVEVKSDALGHTVGTATCVKRAKCNRCNKEYGEVDANNHVNLGLGGQAVDASCENDGREWDTVCMDCHATIKKGNVIKATGHSLETYYDKTKDVLVEHCLYNCGYKKETTIPKLSFSFKEFRDVGYVEGVVLAISGGYGDRFDCEYYHRYYIIDSFPTQNFHRIERNETRNAVLLSAGSVSNGDVFEITVTDQLGHSVTKTFTCIVDPHDAKKRTMTEI